MSERDLFDLTDEQRFYIDTAAGQAAKAAVAEYARQECNRSCPRMDNVETVVFGSSERKIVGVDDRVRQLERFEARVARLTWLVVGQIVVLLGGVVTAVAALIFATG